MNFAKTDKSIPLKELAKGYCLAVSNACRLVDDGGMLLREERYLSAINLFRLAAEEFAKAHIITNAAVISETDQEKWVWFYDSIHNHREKLRVLEYVLHWEGYRDKDEFNRRITLLIQQREDSLYVGFDKNSKKFLPAGSRFKSVKDYAEIEHKYIRGLLRLFTPMDILPTPEIMIGIYREIHQKEMQRNLCRPNDKVASRS